MLRIIQNSTAAGAKSYYSTADYYTEGQELEGKWRGCGAQRLGLSGVIEKGDWDALCDNRDPQTGETLTVRQKANRRVGYDCNFHAPKSLSVLYAMTQDERIEGAFRDAVGATMNDMESELQARVRIGGRNEDRTVGNAVWGEFVHTTARPVDGVPDPHLHAHCFIFNSAFDEHEGRWKAIQLAGIKRDAPYFEAMFHSRLSRNLAELGVPIRRTQHGWEIDGIDQAVLGKFSRRTAQIEAEAEAKGITDPEVKGELGAKTRSKKAAQMSMGQLQDAWRDRMEPEEQASFDSLVGRVGEQRIDEEPGHASHAVAQALDHCFERQSVVPERTLLARALKNGYGAVAPEQVATEFAAKPLLRAQHKGRACVTTPKLLAEERAMLAFAREGRGTCAPLASGEHSFKCDWLSEDQKQATREILGSHDVITVLRGRAGTGKTTMMTEAVNAIEGAGRQVFTFAPSAGASRGVLRDEGFAGADTVARLLVDEKMQQRTRGGVLWIDEAGLLDQRTMGRLFELAGQMEARIVLSGDRAQHGSVAAGAPLRLLEEEAGLVPAQLREIRRQKSDYKRAVKLLSEGDVAGGFRQLDQLGWIREVGADERYRMLAADYVDAVAAGDTALCVAPTHKEAAMVTNAVREQLKATGRLEREEWDVTVLRSLNLTEAERRDPVNAQPGDVCVFHQNAKGFAKGDRFVVGEGDFPGQEAARFQVYRPQELAIAAGDQLRITAGGRTADGKHALNNGAIYRVRGFDEDGNIQLANGWAVGREFGHLTHGYCTTSHASQGRTVDRVFIAQSEMSIPASSRQQAYVSLSRGRRSAVIFTSDKEALMEAVERSDERLSATELARQQEAQRGVRAAPLRTQQRERNHG